MVWFTEYRVAWMPWHRLWWWVICPVVLGSFLIILAWSHFTLSNIASICDVKPFVLHFFHSVLSFQWWNLPLSGHPLLVAGKRTKAAIHWSPHYALWARPCPCHLKSSSAFNWAFHWHRKKRTEIERRKKTTFLFLYCCEKEETLYLQERPWS